MNSTSSRPRIYLAGPDVFHADAAAIYRWLKAQCDLQGMEGVAPTDHEVDANLQDAGLIAQRIYEGNVALIRSADAVIANLQDFRGLEPDSGTVFEVGYAVALGKPVVAYGVPPGSYADRVAAAIPCMRADDGEWREVDGGVMVEGLGQRLNLMIARSTTIVDSAQAALDHLAREWGKARR